MFDWCATPRASIAVPLPLLLLPLLLLLLLLRCKMLQQGHNKLDTNTSHCAARCCSRGTTNISPSRGTHTSQLHLDHNRSTLVILVFQ